MSEFDDFIRGIGSDIKNAAEQVSKKAEETFEISRRKAEKVKLKGRIQANYQKLGELVYGGIKNNEDIQAEMEELVFALDTDFERISEIYEEIKTIREGGTVSSDEDMDWEEEYAEGYDEDEDEEIEVEFYEILSEDAAEENEDKKAEAQAFDINID